MNRIKPVLAIVLCMLLNHALAQDIARTKIDLDLKDVTLEEALSRITSLTSLRFNYRTADITGVKGLTYHGQQVTVQQALTALLERHSLIFEPINGNVVIRSAARSAAHDVTIYGWVSSVRSGESLTGATITLSGAGSYSTVTNGYGFYSISVPAGVYSFSCSYTGFQDYGKQIELRVTTRNNIELSLKKSSELETVQVITAGNKGNVRRTATGFHRLDISEIKRMAMVGGEPDVMKSLQFLPGIQTSNEGTTNLSIRGGSYDENLILLDEAPVYNPSHTLGMFSVFNTDALKDVGIYKSVFPAQYGSRLSSVIDVRMKEGNSKKMDAYGGIGLLASRLTFEGPIKKDKSSFMISGRYSNIGTILNASHGIGLVNIRTTNSQVSFYDLNVKINPILGNKDRLFFSAYAGHDKFFLNVIDQANRMDWGNTTATVRWNHVFNAHLFANTSLLYSNYYYSNMRLDDSRNYLWKANLKELTLKTDLDWTIAGGNTVKSGLGITWQDVLPGQIVPQGEHSNVRALTLNNRSSAQLFAYINNEQKIGSSINISYGLRATAFAALGDAKAKYFGAEPRITARYLLSGTASVKFSYGRNYQFQHLLSNSSVGLPTDIWLPSGNHLKPQYSDQYAAGAYRSFANNMYEASLELYYRRSYNVIDFRDNAEVFLNDKIETQVLTGQAKGYGMEWMLKKNRGASTGWISYTFSKALRRIEGVNNNEWYPPVYDHRHNLSLVYNLQLRPRLSIGANWAFRTGGHTTLPEGTFVYGGARFLYYGKRNAYQLPAYHRLDLSVTLQEKVKHRRKWQGEWVLSVYDVYDRKNVFSLFVNQDPIFFAKTTAKMVYLTGVLPTLTYNFKF